MYGPPFLHVGRGNKRGKSGNVTNVRQVAFLEFRRSLLSYIFVTINYSKFKVV